jgi:hypothetical protein
LPVIRTLCVQPFAASPARLQCLARAGDGRLLQKGREGQTIVTIVLIAGLQLQC